MQTDIRLPGHAAAATMGGMARENKTETILLRVRPSMKAFVERVAEATGQNVTETMLAAFEAYCATKKVREALAGTNKEETE